MHNQRVTTLADQHFDGIALFFCFMIAVADQHILLVLLGNNIHRFHQRAKNASDTSITTTPMVSLTCVASACALALGR